MNSTLNPAPCTYDTCSVEEYGQLRYIPSLAGNAFYLALLSLVTLAQALLGIRYRTWGFMFGMLGGLALEILGYIARIQLHYDDFNNTHFIIYLVGLTIGPAFFSGAIYICLARIIAVYGTGLSLLTPRTITVTFVCFDFLSLVLQAAGGALTSLGISRSLSQIGINTMIAGLASQVASTTAFCCICIQIMTFAQTRPALINRNSSDLRASTRFHLFLYAIPIATVAILIRCSFRVAELSKGFGSDLANDEVMFMTLDGGMMSLAVLTLTIGHPGPALGTMWRDGGFKLWRPKKRMAAYELTEVPHTLSLRTTLRK